MVQKHRKKVLTAAFVAAVLAGGGIATGTANAGDHRVCPENTVCGWAYPEFQGPPNSPNQVFMVTLPIWGSPRNISSYDDWDSVYNNTDKWITLYEHPNAQGATMTVPARAWIGNMKSFSNKTSTVCWC
jgi:hypothetical protein